MGWKLGDDEHRVRIGGVNDVARIDLPQSNPPRDGRSDVAIDKVQLRTVDGGLVVPNGSLELVHRGLLRIHLLLGHWPGARQQTLEPLIVQLGIAQPSLVSELRGLGLLERNLVWSRVRSPPEGRRS